MNGNNEKIQTKELQSRYGLRQSTVYRRMEKLHIKPLRDENSGKACITTEQLQLMDDLNAHMEGGGKMNEFVQQCRASGRIVVPTQPAVEPTTETAIVCQVETQTTALEYEETVATKTLAHTTSPENTKQNSIKNLHAQKREEVENEDIQKTNELARKRAFDKAMGEETLLLFYEATEEFTPEQKEQLQEHRAACNQVREERTQADVNNFLSKAISMTGIKF